MAADNSFLYLNHNIGITHQGEADNSFLYLNHNLTDDQPPGQIIEADPIIAVPGETVVLSGYNFKGANNGAQLDPVVRFYTSTNIAGFYEELVVVGSWSDTEVTVTIPYTTPAAGYFVIYHEGAEAGPIPYSNFFAVAVDKEVSDLECVDFDPQGIAWATGTSMSTYWIGMAALKGAAYFTSKRGAPWKFQGNEGGGVTALTVSDFSVSGDAVDDEIQSIETDGTGGTFTLTLDTEETVAIAYNATAATVRQALRDLPNVDNLVTVTGSGTSADPWIVTFVGTGLEDQDQLVADDTNLTGETLGTVVTTVSEGGDVAVPDDSFPKAFHAVTKHARIFVANVQYPESASESGTELVEHKSRLHWSSQLAPEKWYGTDYIDFDPDDGQEITGMVSYGESIMVFKNHSVQLLAGSSETSFARTVLDSKIGTVSPYSVQTIGGMLFFFDRDTGVWEFDGAAFNAVSDKIRTYLLDGQSYHEAYKACAFTYRSKYVLSVPWGGATYPNRTFVYDTKTKAWTEYDYGVRDAIEVNERIFGVAPDDAVGTYELNSSNTDAGVPIAAEFETAWVAPEGHSVKHRMRNVDVTFANKGGAVKTELFTDFDGSASVADQTVTVNDLAKDQVFTRISGVGKTRWRSSQLKFSNVAGSDFQLNRVTMLFSALRRKRGVESPNG